MEYRFAQQGPASGAYSPTRSKTIYGLLLGIFISTSCAVDVARLPSNSFERSSSALNTPSDLTALQAKAQFPTESVLSRAGVEPLADFGLSNNSADTTIAVNDSQEGLITQQALLDVSAINAPIDALLFSLATQSNYQLQLLGNLSGRVTLKLDQATLPDILQQLATQARFSWSLESPKLLIWSGGAYRFSYSVDYLNIQRATKSSVGLATQVGTINATNASGDSIANSSRTHIENTSQHDFWESLARDMTLLLSSQSALNDLANESAAQYSINAEAGLLTLFAPPEAHQAVKQYLERLHRSTQRQVLIEASVVEVTLSDSFEAGIDWQVLAKGLSGVSAAQVLVGAPTVAADTIDRLVSPAGLVSMVHQGGDGDLTATLSLLERFGDVKILSRPRIIALNNQSSVLKVVDNRVYFTAKVERSQTDTKSEIVTQTEIHTVPVGLVMNVTPQISADGAVMLNVRPTLSRILGFVNDPNPELALANIKNGVPEIQVREMESMLRVQSGEVAVIGGLMQETNESDQSRLPGLGRLPWVKHLFSHRMTTQRQTELLIVLRPTIVTLDGDAAS